MSKAGQLYQAIRKILESSEPDKDSFSDDKEYVKALWNFYNDKYFDGMMNEPVIFWLQQSSKFRVGALGTTQLTKRGTVDSIKLSPYLMRDIELLKETLLHEMCHQAVIEIDRNTRDKHGPVWKKWARKCGIPESTKGSRTLPNTQSEQEHLDNLESENARKMKEWKDKLAKLGL